MSKAFSLCLHSQTQEREEDQRILNLVGDALRLLGNTLVVLGDLRCNLTSSPPRHLYVIRPMAHYTHPVLLQAGLPHMPIPVGSPCTDLLCGIVSSGEILLCLLTLCRLCIHKIWEIIHFPTSGRHQTSLIIPLALFMGLLSDSSLAYT